MAIAVNGLLGRNLVNSSGRAVVAEPSRCHDNNIFQGVFDSMQDGLIVIDCDFNVVRVNPWVEKLFYLNGSAVGKKCYEVFRGMNSPCSGCPGLMVHEAGDERASYSELIAYPSRENPEQWIDLLAFPLTNAEGKFAGIVERMRDVTERKRAQDAHLHSEMQKQALLDASIDLIRYVDKDMRIIWANRRTMEALGISHEQIAGEFCYKLFVGRDRPCNDCPSEKAKLDGGVRRAVMYKDTIGGRPSKTYWDCYAVPIKNEYGETTNLIQISRDVTDQMEAERELKRKHNALEAINGVLLRVTREYNLTGMSSVLVEILEHFYPEFEAWLFLLTPQRDSFYVPRPGTREGEGACYQRAVRECKRLNMEDALLCHLANDNVRPSCSGSEQTGYSPVIKEMARGFTAWMAVPIEVEQKCHGLLMLGSSSSTMDVSNDLVFVEALIRQVSGVIRYQVSKEAQEDAFRKQLAGPDKFMGLIGQSQPMQKLYGWIESVANSANTVLITGESGTGKELVARAIHQAGRYSDKPFIVAHCSSFVPTLAHSEIFGHEKGAFTGAINQKKGRLERAQGGILFLDEVADLPLETQVLLLRFLQEKTYERVGGEHLLEANVRVVAATYKDVEKEMKAGRLREDFYYRLSVLPMKLPPLRERPTDITLLANHFLRTHSLIEGKEVVEFDSGAMKLLIDYDWPGNVRELQNTVARCVVLASGKRIGSETLPARIQDNRVVSTEGSLADNERALITRIMHECIGNKHQAARRLNISRGTLYSKLKKYGLAVGK